MSQLILAIDPGKTSGIAYYDPISELFDTIEVQKLSEFYELIEGLMPRTIIIERGFTAGNPAAQTVQIEWAAYARAFATVISAETISQEPSIPHTVTSRFQLKRKRISQHQYDALAHILGYYYYTLKCGVDQSPVKELIQAMNGVPNATAVNSPIKILD